MLNAMHSTLQLFSLIHSGHRNGIMSRNSQPHQSQSQPQDAYNLQIILQILALSISRKARLLSAYSTKNHPARRHEMFSRICENKTKRANAIKIFKPLITYLLESRVSQTRALHRVAKLHSINVQHFTRIYFVAAFKHAS